jgi:hypothetical protein
MSHSKKDDRAEDSVREKEPPAHRTRRQFKAQAVDFIGKVDDELLDLEEEVSNFEPIKRKKR